MRGRWCWGLALVAVGALAACASDDAGDGSTESPTTGTEAGDPAATVDAAGLDPTTTVATTTTSTTTTTTAASATTAAPEDEGFALPADVVAELDDAGLGYLIDLEYPDQPDDVPWPTDEWPRGEIPADADPATVDQIVATAFAPATNPDGSEAGRVEALLVVHGGEIVLEEYNGWDPAAAHTSWSMAKSITQALLGVLVADGRLDPFAPAPVPEWSDPADPRHPITVDDLLHMRSGLEWEESYVGESDAIRMLFGDAKTDRGAFAASKPLADPIGEVFAYSTGTSEILARVIADEVGSGDVGTAWAEEVLFSPLGITSVEHDLDGRGVMNGGANINMTAQDFARIGLLYLRGGEWDGERILPESWIDYARTPRPADPFYGAHWWLDALTDGQAGAVGTQRSFSALGFAGQSITVVPDEDLVAVALANTPDDRSDVAAAALVDAFST